MTKKTKSNILCLPRKYGINGLMIIIMMLGILNLLLPRMSWGEKTSEKAIKLEEIVVTATKSEKGLADVPGSISVIKGEDIDNSPNITLDEVFRYSPSIQIIRGEGIGTTHNFTNIRGVGSSRNLLYVDGVSMVESMSGNTNLSFLPTDGIERVEVLRGPSSALYGGRAMGGVINILTKAPEKGLKGSFKPSFGNYNYEKYMGNMSYGGEKLGFAISFTDARTDNYWSRDKIIYRTYDYRSSTFSYDYDSEFDNPNHVGWEEWNRNYDEWSIRPKVCYSPSESTQMILSLGFMENETGNGYTDRYMDATGNDVEKYLKKEKTYVGLTGKTRLSEGSDISYRLTYHEPESRNTGENMDLTKPLSDPDQLAPGGRAPQFYRSESRQGSKDYELELTWTKPISSQKVGEHVLTLGAEYMMNDIYWSIKEQDTERSLTTPVDTTKDAYSIYLQDEFLINDRFTLTTGLRGDFYDDFSDRFSPKGTLLFKPNPKTQYFLSGGTAFNPPPYSQKFGTDWNMTAYNIRTNNPDLDAEKLWSVELGIRRNIGQRFKFSIAGYYSEAKDLIESIKEKKQIGGVGNVNITYEYHDNIEKAVFKGIESEFHFDLNENHRFSGGLTIMRSENKETHKRLERNPGTMGYIAYMYNQKVNMFDVENRLWATLRGRGQDEFYIGEYTREEPQKVSGFFVADLSLGLDVGNHFGLFLNATNLFDKTYREFTYTRYQPGRLVVFGGRIIF